MEHKDIDLFVKAKRKTLVPGILTVISALLFASIFVLEIMEIKHDNTMTILSFAFVFYSTAYGAGKWAFVPREKLITIIEKQINNDADALSYLISKTSKS